MPPPTVRCHLLPCNDATTTVTRLPEGRRWRSSAYGQRRPPPSSNLLSDGPDGTDLEPLLYSSLCEQMEISQLNDQVAQLQHLVWDKGSMLVSPRRPLLVLFTTSGVLETQSFMAIDRGM